MSYFPCDIPFMSEDEKKKNGIKCNSDVDKDINVTSNDTISRQAAIDIERRATVDTNPEHFESHQKFVEFMDDAEISSFGRWQWSNGFNTALTAVGIDLKRLPSAQTKPDKNPLPEQPDSDRLGVKTGETCTDTISRQDAIDQLHQAYNLLDAEQRLEDMPSAQPDEVAIHLAYMRGKIDGIKECTEKLRKHREEFE